MKIKEIEFSLLVSYDSVLDALMDILGLSKNQIKKFFNKPSKLSARIARGSVVHVPIDLINYEKINPVYDGPDVEIIFEDENFLILNKPTEVHMHPLVYSDKTNLVSFVQTYDLKLGKINEKNLDRGFIYRLDFETSGIVYYSKSTALYEKVRKGFSEVALLKSYLAIVEGNLERVGSIEHTYLQKPGAKKVQVSEEGFQERISIDIVKLAYDKTSDTTLVKVSLKEGKRHQIRAQLWALGHPIKGDELYGASASKRIFLHCHRYTLNVADKLYEYEANADELFGNFPDFDVLSKSK